MPPTGSGLSIPGGASSRPEADDRVERRTALTDPRPHHRAGPAPSTQDCVLDSASNADCAVDSASDANRALDCVDRASDGVDARSGPEDPPDLR